MGYGQADQTDREMMALALQPGADQPGRRRRPGRRGAGRRRGVAVIAAGHNERVQRGDPVAHGEISCLRNAGRRPSYLDTTLYTTLSPCQMCTGAILLFQIPRVVVGEAQTFAGDLGFLVRPRRRDRPARRRRLHGRHARVPDPLPPDLERRHRRPLTPARTHPRYPRTHPRRPRTASPARRRTPPAPARAPRLPARHRSCIFMPSIENQYGGSGLRGVFGTPWGPGSSA